MGVVHLALDPAGRAVAIKVLRPHIASDPDARRRLAREVATLRRVRHPRIAAVIDADVEGETPYVVTSFVPGKPLDAHIRDHGPLPRGHVARVGAVLAEALRAIHDLGIVHRDVKPANVMLLDGDPILIDFGIAHLADESRITHTGLVMGTPGYLSPEIIGGDAVTAATDWWGWGATLAFAATGRPPFGTGPIEVVLDRVRRGQSDITGVDAGLRATLTAALAVDPARRPSPDRLVAGLAASAPIRNGSFPGSAPSPDDVVTVKVPPPVFGRDAVTTVTPPPVSGRDAVTTVTPSPVSSRDAVTTVTPPPSSEAVTTVVPPPSGWGSPLSQTRRFDAPSPPANQYGGYSAGGPPPAAARSAGPANGFGGVPGRDPAAGPRVAPAPLSRPSQPAQPAQPAQPPRSPWSPPAPRSDGDQPASSGSSLDPAAGVLLGVLVVLAALAAVAPYGAVWIAGFGMAAARVVDRTNTALLLRRDQRGPRGSDGLVAAMALPWRFVKAGVSTLFALVLPILIGISVAFMSATAMAGTSSKVVPSQPGPLALGMVALLLTAWWGPGGGPVRRGAAKGVHLICPGPRARIVVWGILILALISAFSVMRADSHPDWGPLQNSKIFNMLS